MLVDNALKAINNIEKISSNVTIVAATKTVLPEVINQLPSCGIEIAGENRVQELLSKYDDVKGLTWHFVGRLQRNKVKYIVDKVEMIHSVDSRELADEIQKRCKQINKVMDVLIEVNIGNELSKGGISVDELDELCDYISSLPNLRLKGLMSVLPIGAEESLYEDLNKIFQGVQKKYPTACILSAGMSSDYEIAVKHGANMVRLGTCLFGHRIYNKL